MVSVIVWTTALDNPRGDNSVGITLQPVCLVFHQVSGLLTNPDESRP